MSTPLSSAAGTVYLVGAGPGDPGLMTLKGRELIEQADCLVYDALVPTLMLSWAKADCKKIYVGKRSNHHALPQAQINELLVRCAGEYACTVRLKGGDPYIFGRGGEEAAVLAAAGVRFRVIPGISSAIAGPAYAGIPITHRAHCSAFSVFTGHEDAGKPEPTQDYAALAATPGTKVMLMGMSRLRGPPQRRFSGPPPRANAACAPPLQAWQRPQKPQAWEPRRSWSSAMSFASPRPWTGSEPSPCAANALS